MFHSTLFFYTNTYIFHVFTLCVCLHTQVHAHAEAEVNSQALVPAFSTMWILEIILRSQIFLVALIFETGFLIDPGAQ